ncbi:MAG TPA: serine/threonine-protein kinase [Streptosporangiaceae bacterium]|nr:serine/threonine-protein kinase [Streptosporangiaceae bacterium]
MTQDNPGVPGGFGPGSRVAGYLLEEQIGQGGMAVVFRAHDERLDRTVALKILAPALAADEAFRQRFIRESRAAAAVDDPHIIPVFEAGESSGVLFIAMRYVRGGDVRSMVRDLGPLPAGRAVEVISQVASALDAAHARGLVHRDVKPANMLLDAQPSLARRDHVYLSDFGLSKGSLQATGLTGTGTFLGTLDYIAPEQIEGRPVDGRADEYALACAAFELITGRPPFQRDDAMAIMYAQLSEPPPPISRHRGDVPAAVDGVFARALAKSPADRYTSCTEFAEALRDSFGLRPYDSGPGSVPDPHQATRVVGSGSAPGAPTSGGQPWHPGTEAVTPGGAMAGAPTQFGSGGGRGNTSPDLNAGQWHEGPGYPAGPPPGAGGGYQQGGRRPWWRAPGGIAAIIVIVLILAGGGGYLALHHSSSDGNGSLTLPGCTSATASAQTLKVPNSRVPTPNGENPFGVLSPDGKFAFAVTASTLQVYSIGPGPSLTHKFAYMITNGGGAATGIAITHDGKYLVIAAGNGVIVENVAMAEAGAGSASVGTLTVPGLTGNGQAVNVAVSKQDKYVFVSIKARNQVAIFNLKQALTSGFNSSDYVGSIRTGANPVGIAISPDGHWLYIASNAPGDPTGTRQGQLTVANVQKAERNPATSVVVRANAGCQPSRIAPSADGKIVWITARGSNSVLAFSASLLRTNPSHALMARVQVGLTPIGLTLVKSGSRIVVADTDVKKTQPSDNLAVINVANALAGKSSLLGYVPTGKMPREFGVVPGGRYLLVSDNGSGQVQIVDVSKLP